MEDNVKNNKVKVFIAGPMFSSGSMGNNIRNAVTVATKLRDAGFLVHIPHLCFFWYLIIPREREFWTTMDLEELETCHVIYRLPGKSSGADDEVEHARKWNVGVYADLITGDSGEEKHPEDSGQLPDVLPELLRLIDDYPGGNLPG